MKPLDGEPAILPNVPRVIHKKAKALLASREVFTEVQLIQKRLVTDDRMVKVWKTFDTLPMKSQSLAVQLFFAKFPRIIFHGKKPIADSGWDAVQRQKDLLQKMDDCLKQAKIFQKTLKALGAKRKIILPIERILGELDERIVDLCESSGSSSYFESEAISREYGKDYRKVFDFRKRGAKNAPVLFSIRAAYLVLRECGFEKPPLGLVGIIAAVAADYGQDLDKTSVREQVRSLNGPLSFTKSRFLSAREEFSAVGKI